MAEDNVICFETFKGAWLDLPGVAEARIEAVIETWEVRLEFMPPAA